MPPIKEAPTPTLETLASELSLTGAAVASRAGSRRPLVLRIASPRHPSDPHPGPIGGGCAAEGGHSYVLRAISDGLHQETRIAILVNSRASALSRRASRMMPPHDIGGDVDRERRSPDRGV